MSVKKIVSKLLCIFLISSNAYAVGNEKLYAEIIEKLNFDPKLDPSVVHFLQQLEYLDSNFHVVYMS